MSQIKISALNDLNAAPASNDKLVIVDTSAAETKRIDINDLFTSPVIAGDVSIEDKIVHTGDTNTAIRFPANDTVTIETAGLERARVDSSGNFLVGSTDSFGTSAGFKALASGLTRAVRDGDVALAVSRLTDDGDIAAFQKDGTTVGTIGTEGGHLSIGTAACAIKFDASTNSILSWNQSTNALRDTVHSIGSSSSRFKNLYLSGGVYLGGTGGANLLDDYEEGTWTVTDTSGASLSLTGASGTYTKVGRMVTCSINFTMPTTSDSNPAEFGGLPFVVANNQDYRGAITVGYSSATVNLAAGLTDTAQSTFKLRETDNESTATNADLSGAALYLLITYFVA